MRMRCCFWLRRRASSRTHRWHTAGATPTGAGTKARLGSELGVSFEAVAVEAVVVVAGAERAALVVEPVAEAVL